MVLCFYLESSILQFGHVLMQNMPAILVCVLSVRRMLRPDQGRLVPIVSFAVSLCAFARRNQHSQIKEGLNRVTGFYSLATS